MSREKLFKVRMRMERNYIWLTFGMGWKAGTLWTRFASSLPSNPEVIVSVFVFKLLSGPCWRGIRQVVVVVVFLFQLTVMQLAIK